jgi:hypothetical protein
MRTFVHTTSGSPSLRHPARVAQDPVMETLLVLMLIAVLGLFAQAVGADTRGFDHGRAT